MDSTSLGTCRDRRHTAGLTTCNSNGKMSARINKRLETTAKCPRAEHGTRTDSDALNGAGTARPAVATFALQEPSCTGGVLGPAPAREGGGWESSERPPPEPGERKHQHQIKSEGNVWKERSAEPPETGSSTKEQNKKCNSKTQRPRKPGTDSRRGRGGPCPGSRSSGAERGRDPGTLAQATTPQPSGWCGGECPCPERDRHPRPAHAPGRSRPQTGPSCKADEGGSLWAPHTHQDVTGSVSICSSGENNSLHTLWSQHPHLSSDGPLARKGH